MEHLPLPWKMATVPDRKGGGFWKELERKASSHPGLVSPTKGSPGSVPSPCPGGVNGRRDTLSGPMAPTNASWTLVASLPPSPTRFLQDVSVHRSRWHPCPRQTRHLPPLIILPTDSLCSLSWLTISPQTQATTSGALSPSLSPWPSMTPSLWFLCVDTSLEWPLFSVLTAAVLVQSTWHLFPESLRRPSNGSTRFGLFSLPERVVFLGCHSSALLKTSDGSLWITEQNAKLSAWTTRPWIKLIPAPFPIRCHCCQLRTAHQLPCPLEHDLSHRYCSLGLDRVPTSFICDRSLFSRY